MERSIPLVDMGVWATAVYNNELSRLPLLIMCWLCKILPSEARENGVVHKQMYLCQEKVEVHCWYKISQAMTVKAYF